MAFAYQAFRIGILALSAWLIIPAPLACAQSTADQAAAQALFEQGRELMSKGDYEAACEKLRTSNELDPGLGTLLFLADCYERAGRLASAWEAFVDAGRIARERGDRERSEIAEVRAAALKPRLVYLVIEVPAERPEGFEVRANGRVVDGTSFGATMPIDTGETVVTATAPGYRTQSFTVQVVEGAKTPYRAVVQPMQPNEPAPVVTAAEPGAMESEPAPSDVDVDGDDDGSSQRTIGMIVGGVGAASLIVSGIFTGLASGNHSDSKGECLSDDPNRCTSRGVSLRDDALSQAAVATVAGIVGSVALASGVVLYLTAPGPVSDSGHEMAIGIGGSF